MAVLCIDLGAAALHCLRQLFEVHLLGCTALHAWHLAGAHGTAQEGGPGARHQYRLRALALPPGWWQ